MSSLTPLICDITRDSLKSRDKINDTFSGDLTGVTEFLTSKCIFLNRLKLNGIVCKPRNMDWAELNRKLDI